MTTLRLENDVDRVAAALAANAGQLWERLETYPGYLRNRWREDARRLIAGLAAGHA